MDNSRQSDTKTQPIKKSGSRFTATSLRNILSFVLLFTSIATAAAFYLGTNVLQDFAVEVQHVNIDADASLTQVENLKALDAQLAKSDSVIQKAEAVFSTQGAYQSQAIKDVQRYASLAKLSVASTTFTNDNQGTGRSFVVNFNEPVDYAKFISFLKGIESNIPKIVITELSITGASTDNNLVTINTLTMSILVR